MCWKSFRSLCLAFLCAPGAAGAQSAAEGRVLYTANDCASCHGVGLVAPEPRRDLPARVTYDFESFAAIVERGRTDAGMPSFAEVFSSAELCSLYLYVRSGRRGAMPETAEVCAPSPPPDLEDRLFPEATGPTYRLRCQGAQDIGVAFVSRRGNPVLEQKTWTIFVMNLRGFVSIAPGECAWTGEIPDDARVRYSLRDGARVAIQLTWPITDWRPFRYFSRYSDSGAGGFDPGPAHRGPVTPYRFILANLQREDRFIEFEVQQEPPPHDFRWTVIDAAVVSR